MFTYMWESAPQWWWWSGLVFFLVAYEEHLEHTQCARICFWEFLTATSTSNIIHSLNALQPHGFLTTLKRKFALKTISLGFCLTLLHCERLKQQIFEASVGSVCIPCFCDYGFSILKNKIYLFLRTQNAAFFLTFMKLGSESCVPSVFLYPQLNVLRTSQW